VSKSAFTLALFVGGLLGAWKPLITSASPRSAQSVEKRLDWIASNEPSTVVSRECIEVRNALAVLRAQGAEATRLQEIANRCQVACLGERALEAVEQSLAAVMPGTVPSFKRDYCEGARFHLYELLEGRFDSAPLRAAHERYQKACLEAARSFAEKALAAKLTDEDLFASAASPARFPRVPTHPACLPLPFLDDLVREHPGDASLAVLSATSKRTCLEKSAPDIEKALDRVERMSPKQRAAWEGTFAPVCSPVRSAVRLLPKGVDDTRRSAIHTRYAALCGSLPRWPLPL
jgi:hypothetical protein